MVFEGGPLEADAVDESSPPLLLRPIMWMLGGSGGTSSPDEEENIARDTKTSDDDDDDAIPGPCSTDADEDENDDDDDYLVKNRSPPRFMSQSSPPPGVVRASDGEIDGSSSDEESPALSSANAGGGIPGTVAEMAALSLSESTQGVVNASSSPKSRSAGSLNSRSTQRLRPSSRKLSWSDRAGGDLATYSAYDVSIFSAAIIFTSSNGNYLGQQNIVGQSLLVTVGSRSRALCHLIASFSHRPCVLEAHQDPISVGDARRPGQKLTLSTSIRKRVTSSIENSSWLNTFYVR